MRQSSLTRRHCRLVQQWAPGTRFSTAGRSSSGTHVRRTSGFTLLEVLLAVALSGVLLALMGTAMTQFLERVDSSRDVVEQAQLARGVLRMIADDLRNTAVVYEQDISSVQTNAESQALFDVDEADSEPVQEQTAEETRPYIGVMGDATTMQIDLHRVRPVYNIAPESDDTPVTMSVDAAGIVSVRYLLSPQGLIRQQLTRDRAIEVELTGQTGEWELTQRLVAPEVAEIRFRYHDGEAPMEYWDLDENEGASPLAVEVTVGIRPVGAGDSEEADPAPADQKLTYYRLMVPLPVPPEAAASSEDDSAAGEGGDR